MIKEISYEFNNKPNVSLLVRLAMRKTWLGSNINPVNDTAVVKVNYTAVCVILYEVES